jgi:hypothetical protein
MDKIENGYKSVSNIYDRYITSGNILFKTELDTYVYITKPINYYPLIFHQ